MLRCAALTVDQALSVPGPTNDHEHDVGAPGCHRLAPLGHQIKALVFALGDPIGQPDFGVGAQQSTTGLCFALGLDAKSGLVRDQRFGDAVADAVANQQHARRMLSTPRHIRYRRTRIGSSDRPRRSDRP